MYNFTLNNFFTGHDINLFFAEYSKIHPEALIDKNIRFNQIEGTVPYNIWGGTLNINKGQNISSYNTLGELFKNEMISPRLDFSSVVLQPEDFENNYNRIILEQANNGAPYIAVSNLQLYEFIKSKYPYYCNFVLSENAWNIMDITPDILNCILENEDFKLVTLPSYIDDEYIDQIQHKEKIEIMINPPCVGCKFLKDCSIEESANIYDFSEQSVYASCPKVCPYKNRQVIPFEELKNHYLKKGITHFKISGTNSIEMGDYFIFLISYFFTEPHREIVLKDFFSKFTRKLNGGN